MPRQRSSKEYLLNAAVHKAVSNAVTNLKKELQQYIDEQLNNHCTTTETVSSESAGMQTIIDDLRNELSETRTALDAVTLDRNQYKRIKELAECKLWDEQDQRADLQAQIKELTDANLELTQKIQHPHAKQIKSIFTDAYNNYMPGCFEHSNEFKPYTVSKTENVTEPLTNEHDQKDELQEKIKELTTINQELTQKIQHLTVQNENLNKLLNYNSDSTADELQSEEVRYIVFPRTNLSKCFKANSIDTVIYYINGEKSCGTYAFAYDRIKSQLDNADVAMFHDHFIVKL